MPHLHDMEELVNSIQSNKIKEYMKEALSCYMASAYRACIVLTYISLFDDIVTKLGELGKVNRKAKRIHDEAEKRMEAQDIYEKYLIDQLQSHSLLPSLDMAFLEILRVLRNKSAHPSGHNASAEEARFIFFEAINRFLSKPILTTTQLVDDILSRLDGEYFFPSTDIGSITSVVMKELENIHYSTYPYLVNKFLEKTSSPNSEVARNADFFLTGLASIKDSLASESIVKYIIEPKCSDSNYSMLILRLVSANGDLTKGLESVVYQRLKALLVKRIETVPESSDDFNFSHPYSVFKSMLESLGEEFLINNFESELRKLFKTNIFSSYFLTQIDKYPNIADLYLDVSYERAGSDDFDIANYYSRNLIEVEGIISKFIRGEQALLLLLNIVKAGGWGAWGAKSLMNSKFLSVPKIKTKAIGFVDLNSSKSERMVKKILGEDEYLEDILGKYLS